MSNHVNFPFLLPFKFVPRSTNPGPHFDDAWTCEQIKSFQKAAYYKQKWGRSDTTTLQIESTIAPNAMLLYDERAVVVKTFDWTLIFTGPNYKIYQLVFDISDKPEGVYWIYQQVQLMAINWEVLSEPIHSKTTWPNTMKIDYKNSFNKDGVAWTTGLQMSFRVEAAIMDMNPEAEATSYINQIRDSMILDGTAYRTYKLYIGEAPGVAPWVMDLLNRIFICDYVMIEGKKYTRESGAKWEITRQKNYPLVGGSLEIVESANADGLQFSETTPLAPGIVVAYNMQTAFFGPGALVPVADVEEQG